MNPSNNTSPAPDASLADVFFKPLFEAAHQSASQRPCFSLSDDSWLKLGVQRVLGNHPSGRSLLQSTLSLFTTAPSHQLWFESLKSSRRLRFCRDTAMRVFHHGIKAFNNDDVLRHLPALRDFEVLAGDGHFISHACHDPRQPSSDGGARHYPTGHFYLLDLRRHLLRHLMLGDQLQRKKEHDIRAIKRAGAQSLREGIPTGRKTLLIWDPAGIDFKLWHEYKAQHGIYFISRSKENLAFMRCGQRPWDRADSLNHGIESDQQVGSGTQGYLLRKVTYTDPQSGRTYEFITNEMTLPPGLIALLYRMRWDIEKVFDELKNKLQQTKAWASSATAKQIQAQFICLIHNLMRLMQRELAAEGIEDRIEIKRRAESRGVKPPRQKRRPQDHVPDKSRNQRKPALRTRVGVREDKDKVAQQAAQNHWPQNLRRWLLRLTQRGVKFIRWLRTQLLFNRPWSQACEQLRQIYQRG